MDKYRYGCRIPFTGGKLAYYTVIYLDVGEGLLRKLFAEIARADIEVHGKFALVVFLSSRWNRPDPALLFSYSLFSLFAHGITIIIIINCYRQLIKMHNTGCIEHRLVLWTVGVETRAIYELGREHAPAQDGKLPVRQQGFEERHPGSRNG